MKPVTPTLCLLLAMAATARAESLEGAYKDAHALTMKDGVPLLVYVGQPARQVPGTRAIAVDAFPGATAPCVVVGVVRDGEMYRKDLTSTPTAPDIQVAIASLSTTTWAEALDEVNATRAARGLRPFIRDSGLTLAAAGCAEFRATRLIEGHTSNDFAAVPAGSMASSAGCAAWPQGMGWGSCCTYDNYTYAGAAYSIGRDGRRYMHLFVR